MKYGLIGERLGHSFSKLIHEKIGDYVYEIKEIAPENVQSFMHAREFEGINVTIPYKETVIPMLDYVDEFAKKIGAVNTVVNRNGKLYGYNTDYLGMRALVVRVGVDPKCKKALILGTGGTSKTAYSVLADMGANEIIFTSHSGKDGALSYDDIYKYHNDAEIIVNTTPVGMYPSTDACPIELEKFTKAEAVIDAIYNPIRTKLVLKAKELGIKAEGGLYMLSMQAVYAYEYFFDKKADPQKIERIYNEVLNEKTNIALVGMPSSGKSTVGKIVANLTGKKFIDTDEEIVKAEGKKISDIFKDEGEAYFRALEAKIVCDVSKFNGFVIATGGGAVLKKENVEALKQNGVVYFIDRDLELLIPTGDRPLASDREAIEKRYKERYEIYKSVADKTVNGNLTPKEVAEEILK